MADRDGGRDAAGGVQTATGAACGATQAASGGRLSARQSQRSPYLRQELTPATSGTARQIGALVALSARDFLDALLWAGAHGEQLLRFYPKIALGL